MEKNRFFRLKSSSSLYFVLLILVGTPASYNAATTRVSLNRPSLTTTNKQSKGRSDHNNDIMHVSYYNSFIGNESIENMPDEQRLVYHALRTYDPASRPVYNASKKVTIKFSFALIQICDMDERNQVLTTSVWFEQEWFDERLVWNSSEYNNLDKIRLPCNRIWLPDIVLYNSADDYTEGYMQNKAMVKPSGEVFWSPPAKLRSSCKIDVTYFPFDDQLCTLKFGSWTYSGLQVDIVNRSDTLDISNYIESGEWELISVSFERIVGFYPCCPTEPYPSIVFTIHLRRRILYFLFNIIIPCIWLSIICLVGFWLPPDSGEKITLGITVLLAYSVFMLLIAEIIPATSEMVPLIGIYLTITMSLSSLNIIITVFILQSHHANNFSSEVPPHFYHFMTRRIAKLIGYSGKVREFERHRSTLNILEAKEINKYQKNTKNCLKSCSRLQRLFVPNTTSVDRTNKYSDETQKKYHPTNLQAYEDNNLMHATNYTIDQDDIASILQRTKEKRISTHDYTRSTKINKSDFDCYAIKNNSIRKQFFSSNDIGNITLKATKSGKESNSSSELVYMKKPIRHTSCCKSKEYIRSLKELSTNISNFLKMRETTEIKTNKLDEWKLMAYILDRFFFWVFAFLTIVFSIVLLLIIPILKNSGYITRIKK